MSALTTIRQNVVILVLLLFVQLLLMSGSARSSKDVSVLESSMMRISSPVVGVAQRMSGGIDGAASSIRDLVTAHARNAQLDAELERARAELVRHREASLENDRLRQLLGMRRNLAPQSIGASVITSNLTGQVMMIVVDRGERHGVRRDLPAVGWGGAVGRVVEVEGARSKIQLLIDPNAGAAGVVQRSRAQGMVVGQGDAPLDLLYVPRFADVVPGDRVVTSGLDGIFPRGFGIGTVTSIEENADGSRTLKLAPEIDFRSLEEVLILIEPVAGEVLESEPLPEAEP